MIVDAERSPAWRAENAVPGFGSGGGGLECDLVEKNASRQHFPVMFNEAMRSRVAPGVRFHSGFGGCGHLLEARSSGRQSSRNKADLPRARHVDYA